MYEQFGAHDVGGAIRFSVYFPGSDSVQRGGDPKIDTLRVYGDFLSRTGGVDWSAADALSLQPQAHDGGTLYTVTTPVLPDGFYQYKYLVRFQNGHTRIVGDPCTRYGGGEHENAGVVVGGSASQQNVVTPLAQRLPQRDLILYELMIDDFTAEYRGNRPPIDAVRDRLDYIVDLGVNAIAFMPWTAWPGNAFSWGYNPFLHFSVEHRYVNNPAQPAEKLSRLKRLISACHERKLHVIMDGVFNHVERGGEGWGFPYWWLYQDPADSPFVGSFADAAFFGDLDFQNVCTNEFIADVCRYWIDQFGIDGLRLDYTKGMYHDGDERRDQDVPGAPLDMDQQPAGLTRLVAAIEQHAADRGETNLSITLEHIEGYAAIDVMNKVRATSCWYDPFHAIARDALKSGWITADVMRLLDASENFAPGRVPTTYIENHDHAQVASDAGGRAQWFRTQPWAIALLTAPGAVLIHNGQEFADDYWMPEYGQEHVYGVARVQPRPVRWDDHEDDPFGNALRTLYRKLIHLRRKHPGLRSANFYPDYWERGWRKPNPAGYGVDLDKGTVIYHRWGPNDAGLDEFFVVVLNFSPETQEVDIPFPHNGTWVDLLSGWTVGVGNWRLANQRVGGNWGHIFHLRG